jgi:prepilin-type N-terminal cleavage/methylation domain-containing protein
MTDRASRNRTHQSSGFTFIEVVIALAVMASAAGIIIGMQGAALRRTVRDSNAQQAMLAARRIMASIEAVNPKNFTVQSQENQPVSAILQTLGVSSLGDKDEVAAMSMLSASLLVEDLPIPLLEKEALMRKIILKVFWGQSLDESLEVVYLQPDPGTPT